MKKLIAIFTLCVILTQHSFAQKATTFRQSILTGKYNMELLYTFSESEETVTLETNLPGLVKANMEITVLQNDGSIADFKINKLLGRRTNILYSSKVGVKQFQIQSFHIQCTEFGENYTLQWNNELNQLNISKGGIPFDYANLAQLKKTSFQVVTPSPTKPDHLPIPTLLVRGE